MPAQRRQRYLVAALFVVTALLVNLPIRAPTDRVNFRAELFTAVGEAFADRHQLAPAEGYLREALTHDPQHARAACRLANVLARAGSIEEAEQLLRDALDWDNRSAETREVLGELLRHQGRWEEAAATFGEALAIDPTSPKAHAGLGDVLAETDRIEEAIKHYRKAVNFTSESGPILLRLAEALVRQQAYKEAIECYRQALWIIEPDPATLNAIAWLLATCPVVELRNCEQAIDLAEHLCRLTEYGQPVALDTLAAAYAECGRLDEAVVWVRRAIETALAAGDQAAVDSFRHRLQTYEKRLQAQNRREPAAPPAP
jgi:tetratricopeptide (TPR) repeat protein